MRARRWLAASLLVATAGGVGSTVMSTAVAAEPTPRVDVPASSAPTTTLVPLAQQAPAQAPHIIPLPNSGAYPKRQGDRGSSQQYLVFALMTAGVGAITLLVVRESRKHPERRTPQPAPKDSSDE